MNDPLCLDPMWLHFLDKITSDIQKFEGNKGKDPSDSVTTFPLWFSSNSLNHDFVWLQLFQRTLTGSIVKRYIEFSRGIYQTFNDLSLVLLNLFQLQVSTSCQHFRKIIPPISLITFKNGIDKRCWLRPTFNPFFIGMVLEIFLSIYCEGCLDILSDYLGTCYL